MFSNPETQVRSVSQLRVLIVMPLAIQKGGGELMLMQLLRNSLGLDVHWTIAFLEDGPMVHEVRALGVNAVVIRAGRLREPIRLIATIRSLRRLIKAEKIEQVFSWMGKAHIYGGIAAWIQGRPAAWYQLDRSKRTSMLDWAIHLIPARAIACCGRDGALSQSMFIPKRRVELVFPGADLDRFDPDRLPTPAQARVQLGLPVNVPLIGMVGRLQYWKGMHVLIQAMREVIRVFPTAQAVIVGGVHDAEPQYAAELDEQIKSLGLEANVQRVGLQSNVPLWMQAMDVIVHASRNEPFGIVVVEAMALGKPLIAGSEGGPKEIVSSNKIGRLVDFGDDAALARSILDYLRQSADAMVIGQQARIRAKDFSSASYAKTLVQFIRRVADHQSMGQLITQF